MKRFTFAILAGGLFIFAAAAIPQDKKTAPQNHAQMMEMLKDSTLMSTMIDHIVSESRMRTMMMRKLAEFAKTDASVMTEMHKMMSGEGAAQASAEKEVLIKFKPGTKSTQIKAMESELGLKQIKEIPALHVRVYRITSAETVSEVIENCEKHAFVEYAEPNVKYKTQK